MRAYLQTSAAGFGGTEAHHPTGLFVYRFATTLRIEGTFAVACLRDSKPRTLRLEIYSASAGLACPRLDALAIDGGEVAEGRLHFPTLTAWGVLFIPTTMEWVLVVRGFGGGVRPFDLIELVA